MDISRAETINGWMATEELQWLAEQAAQHELIVEIGSYRGRSTRALGDNTKGRIIAVDHWRGEAHLPLTEDERNKLYDEFFANVADLIPEVIFPVKLDHRSINGSIPEELAKAIGNNKPDMIFIDGDHTAVRHDIETWLPRIRSGGVICGHDCTFESVSKAVAELVPDFKVAQNTTIWFSYIK